MEKQMFEKQKKNNKLFFFMIYSQYEILWIS